MPCVMARFVLVHGAFCGAWIWEPIVPELRRAGHRVSAIDLPGSGADRSPVADATLDGYAARICQELRADSEPGLLAGRSYRPRVRLP